MQKTLQYYVTRHHTVCNDSMVCSITKQVLSSVFIISTPLEKKTKFCVIHNTKFSTLISVVY